MIFKNPNSTKGFTVKIRSFSHLCPLFPSFRSIHYLPQRFYAMYMSVCHCFCVGREPCVLKIVGRAILLKSLAHITLLKALQGPKWSAFVSCPCPHVYTHKLPPSLLSFLPSPWPPCPFCGFHIHHVGFHSRAIVLTNPLAWNSFFRYL